ncbi:MAG: flagellar biosynthesis protein FliQ [Pseudomonadales bacterium]
MTPEVVLDLLREALYLIILLVCIMIIPSLGVGLIVSVFQAATQINEQTLSFLPRLLTTFLAMMFAGPYILMRLSQFTEKLIGSIPLLIG